MEREARGWSYDGLASRVTEAGCPIQGSAIYKIEKADPPRQITVDEMLGFSAAFEIPVMDLLRPREVVVSAKLSRLFDKWEAARQESLAAQARSDAAFRKMARFVQEYHGDALEPFFEMVMDWSPDDAVSAVEAEAARMVMLASAVPVEPFKKLEREALDALRDKGASQEGD